MRIIKARRLDHTADRCGDVVEDMQRLPPDLRNLFDGLCGEFRGCDVDEHVGTSGFELDDVVVDGGFGGFKAFLGDDHRGGLGAEPVFEALEVVLAVIVVLIQHRDLGVRLLLQEVFGVDPGLALIVRLPSHGPGKILGVIPLGGAGRDEQLRHFLRIHVFVDRRVWRGAERIENQQHLIALDQFARLLNRLWRAVAVVVADEIDLAAVDAASIVDLLEIRGFGLADHAVGRRGAAIRHDVADLDFGICGAGVVFLLGERAGGGGREHDKSGRRDDAGTKRHSGSP